MRPCPPASVQQPLIRGENVVAARWQEHQNARHVSVASLAARTRRTAAVVELHTADEGTAASRQRGASGVARPGAPLHAGRRTPRRACSQGARSHERSALRQQHARDTSPERGSRYCDMPVQDRTFRKRACGGTLYAAVEAPPPQPGWAAARRRSALATASFPSALRYGPCDHAARGCHGI